MTLGQSLCNLQLQIQNENKPYCTPVAKKCADRWIKLHARDTWLYSCCNECRVRIICSSEIINKQLRGNGLLSPGPGCVIKGDKFLIYSQHDYINQVTISPTIDLDMPKTQLSLNEIMNISLPDNFVSENHEQTYQEIQQKIDIMKQQELEQFTSSNTTHYIIIYTSIFGLVLSLLGILGCYIKSKRRNLQEREPSQQRSTQLSARTIDETSLTDVTVTTPRSKLSPGRMTSALRGSMASVNTGTSPTMPKKIHFDLNNSTNSLN